MLSRSGNGAWSTDHNQTWVNKKSFACVFQDRQFQNPDKLIDSFRNFYLWETVLDQTDAKNMCWSCILDQRNIKQAFLKKESMIFFNIAQKMLTLRFDRQFWRFSGWSGQTVSEYPDLKIDSFRFFWTYIHPCKLKNHPVMIIIELLEIFTSAQTSPLILSELGWLETMR